mmetsp:Transcript_5802/g.12224  ORF Transcript_5802/g.12224 Transcript_5802/m.12224 type:complete len:231 (+) Transcript_5802:2031-2723(+)
MSSAIMRRYELRTCVCAPPCQTNAKNFCYNSPSRRTTTPSGLRGSRHLCSCLVPFRNPHDTRLRPRHSSERELSTTRVRRSTKRSLAREFSSDSDIAARLVVLHPLSTISCRVRTCAFTAPIPASGKDLTLLSTRRGKPCASKCQVAEKFSALRQYRSLSRRRARDSVVLAITARPSTQCMYLLSMPPQQQTRRKKLQPRCRLTSPLLYRLRALRKSLGFSAEELLRSFQ